jgi:hypothetical protein
MLLAVLAAAAVQAAPVPEKPSPDVKRQLACPTGKALPVKALRPGLNSLHKLADEPDAHMIRPVARNYCNEADIVRYNVTGDRPQGDHPPITDIVKPATLQPAGR